MYNLLARARAHAPKVAESANKKLEPESVARGKSSARGFKSDKHTLLFIIPCHNNEEGKGARTPVLSQSDDYNCRAANVFSSHSAINATIGGREALAAKSPGAKSALGSAKLVAKNHYTHGDVGVVADDGGGGSNLHGAQFNLSPVIYKGHKFAALYTRTRAMIRRRWRCDVFFLLRAHA